MVSLIVVLVGLVAVSELTDTTHIFHSPKATSSTIAGPSSVDNNDSETTGGQNGNSETPPVSTPEELPGTKQGGGSSSTAELIAPYGDFVSNHRPGANDSPSIVTSVCITTPGAKCLIRFINEEDKSVVKTLAAGTTDSNGAVYWNNWDVKTAGFTNGKWTIEAVATQNGKSASTTDRIDFEVSL